MYKVPDAKWDNNRCQGDAFISYVYSCHAAEVEVDTDTGQVKVLQMVGCHDAGRIINPQMAAGQVTGGMVMGIGMALTEAVETDPKNGIIRSDNFDSYILPTARDACRMTVSLRKTLTIVALSVETSLGEPAMEPAPAAVSGAVNMALGSAGALRRIPTPWRMCFLRHILNIRGMLDEFLFLSSAHILDGAVPPAGTGEEYALVSIRWHGYSGTG